MKIVNWITGRLSEPSSYAAIGVGVIGIGMISGVGELVVRRCCLCHVRTYSCRRS